MPKTKNDITIRFLIIMIIGIVSNSLVSMLTKKTAPLYASDESRTIKMISGNFVMPDDTEVSPPKNSIGQIVDFCNNMGEEIKTAITDKVWALTPGSRPWLWGNSIPEEVYEEKDQIKENIKYDRQYFYYIMGYAVVRENDMSLCDNLIYPEGCRETATDMMFHRNFAEKKCDSVPSSAKLLCLNRDACDNLPGWQKDYCQGYNLADLSLIKRATSANPEFCKAANNSECRKWSENDAIDYQESLAIYQGFKSHGDKKTCEKYASELQGSRAYLCEVMFSKSPLNDILDGIAEDIAYFLLSKEYDDGSYLCKQIKNANVRAGCLSPERDTYFDSSNP